ncbi:MAG: Phytochrome, two-component sensor histidine kinase [Frankiales bacterium]|nr:Phytochrome, two-component sensor histidine kinase [Frankiales bacterium]
MSAPAQPTVLLHVAQGFELLVCVTVIVVLVRLRRERRSPATGWALAVFGVLGLVLAAAFVPVKDDGSLVKHGFTVVLVCLLLVVPFALLMFARSLTAVRPWTARAGLILTGALVIATLASPRFPQPGEARGTWFTVYVLLLVVGWALQSIAAARGLWSAGRGQPAVVRNRMRVLGAGALVVAADLVSSGSSATPSTAAQVVTTLIGAFGIVLLALAFVLPDWLRASWRGADLAELAATERRLMSAVSPQEVAIASVPAVAQLFGAGGAALVDDTGALLAAVGLESTELVGLNDSALEGDVIVTSGGLFACRLSIGWLVVRPGVFAPLYGRAELSLLDRVASFVDLALQRCLLFQSEATSRAAAEAATTELQTLLYSVSHDLRNPIISVLGYLDVLAQEHQGELKGEGQHYLDRISVNAVYMQHLIQDLLELSRIGRSEPAAQALSLGALAKSVAEEVHALHPTSTISVDGAFPVLWFSELRARQLLTNLIENAAKHSVGAAEVRVTAETSGSGALLLVSDTGRGIPEAYREKAFEVFERLDAAHTDVPGTGMGLPICKRIVEAAGGTITLEGPPPGVPTGTTVRIGLPGSIVQGWHDASLPIVKEKA